MKIAIANDHSAVELKNIIKEHLESKGYEVLNLGTDSTESCDYPVYGEKVGRAVADGEADLGIAICGTGVGISLAANKVKGIRACVCSEPYTAKLSRMHNNSNILAFGARVVGSELAKMIVDEWLGASFEGGRHQRRVDMIMDIENKYLNRNCEGPEQLHGILFYIEERSCLEAAMPPVRIFFGYDLKREDHDRTDSCHAF